MFLFWIFLLFNLYGYFKYSLLLNWKNNVVRDESYFVMVTITIWYISDYMEDAFAFLAAFFFSTSSVFPKEIYM